MFSTRALLAALAAATLTNATLIGKPAPDFTATAFVPGPNGGDFKDIKLSDYKGKKHVVLYWYPLDFTFVCASELIAFSNKKKEWESRNVEVLGISVDSHFTHRAWVNTPKSQGGLENAINHPLVSDLSKEISRNFGVLLESESVAARGVVIIDKDGVVQSEMRNNLPLGRNVDEVLRVVDALQHHEKKGTVCPANWTKGKPDMQPTKEGVTEYLQKHMNFVEVSAKGLEL